MQSYERYMNLRALAMLEEYERSLAQEQSGEAVRIEAGLQDMATPAAQAPLLKDATRAGDTP